MASTLQLAQAVTDIQLNNYAARESKLNLVPRPLISLIFQVITTIAVGYDYSK